MNELLWQRIRADYSLWQKASQGEAVEASTAPGKPPPALTHPSRPCLVRWSGEGFAYMLIGDTRVSSGSESDGSSQGWHPAWPLCAAFVL